MGPLVAYGLVFATPSDGQLHAWNAATGAIQLGYPVFLGAGTDYSVPAAYNGKVYVSNNGKLYAFNALSGTPAAGFPVILSASGSVCDSTLAIANNIVYSGLADGKLYANDATTGAPVAGFPVQVGVNYSTPAIANGRLYIGSDLDGKLYGLDAATGATLPGFPVNTNSSGPLRSGPAVGNGLVYFGDRSNTLMAVNAMTGAVAWQYALPPTFSTEGFDLGSPAIVGNMLVVSSDEGDGVFAFGFPGVAASCGGTPTNSPTITPTSTPTLTPTNTPTGTPTQTFTPTWTFTPTCVSHLWPDPYNPQYAVNGTLKISCLPVGSTVSFFTLAGEMVNQVPESGMMAQWDGKNQQGVPVSTGIYFYVIRNGNNVLGKGKFLVNH